VTELLLVRAVERFRERGANVVSLGLAAMADTRQEMPPLQRQFASLVSEHMRLLKTHRSLFYFKQKFHPCWESRYIVISSTLALPKAALALLRVHQS
jgi:phosphatidylglycerol lysyltransferase